ncbi:DUF2254 family protein [Nonomuraea sp. NPDC049725]|uniref:DUF2254 family protein n=1 Tax=Nonomuraea sp. NPDC049725 TaxID=3154508 RepID=UPI003448C2ED
MARNASVYTPIVFDQFLRRRGNQVTFGFFLGLSLYTFLLPAAARPDNPLAFGAVFLPVFTMVALVMLVTLIYGTIDQMRPTSVLPYIRDAAPHARYQRRALVARTRAAPTLPAEPATEVRRRVRLRRRHQDGRAGAGAARARRRGGDRPPGPGRHLRVGGRRARPREAVRRGLGGSRYWGVNSACHTPSASTSR